MSSHPEQTILNSLTAPADQDNFPKPEGYVPTQGITLTEQEVVEAMNENVINVASKYPKIERLFADPAIQNQTYSLHSFVPSQGATPDKDGVYGMFKFRGAFPTEREAHERAEYLVRNCDSYHAIYVGYVGRPLPATVERKYSQKVDEIDIRNKVKDIINSNVKMLKAEEKSVAEEIKKREEEFQAIIDSEAVDELEEYITLQVKRANCMYFLEENRKREEQYNEMLSKVLSSVRESENRHPEFRDKYIDKYVAKCKEGGVPTDDDKNALLRFMRKFD